MTFAPTCGNSVRPRLIWATPLMLALALFTPAAAAAQGKESTASTSLPPVTERTVAAMRTASPPIIDGRDDDLIWRTAPALTAFRQIRPVEDGIPAFRTEARVAYDAGHLYVFVRAFDPHPDSIVALLARRDTYPPSDEITVLVDGYHDRRTGNEFTVNPAGVKGDAAISQDTQEDNNWDGIWDVATQVDSLGWTAEFRIPLSQIRHPSGGTNTFGFAVVREIQRLTEQVSWPAIRVSRPGMASQFGELTGLADLAPARRIEAAPYLVTKNVSVPTASGFGREQRLSAGADFKVGLASNLTLTGTVNPDFGQVEADPAILNLSAFESFFPERRPFFVEGAGLFDFSVNCSQVNCQNEQLFYSRRIGRAPQIPDTSAGIPTATVIDGALKLTGRLPGGLSIGVLDALTQRETGTAGRTIEPTTNYAVLRVTQDFRGGASGIGMMLTGVNRSLDPASAPWLHREAYAGGLEFRHQFLGRQYQVSGSLDLSRVAGSAAAIAATQLDPVHLYQRPDGALRFDSTRTSLSGDAEEFKFSKIGGERVMFETSYLRRSPGFEINDLGYLRQADQQSWNTWVGFMYNRPRAFYQRLWWNVNWWQYWSAAGLPTERAFNANVHTQLNSRWWIHAGGTLGQLGTTWCDRCARGGPAVRQDPYLAPWLQIQGDDRRPVIPSFRLNYLRTSGGRTHSLDLGPQVTINASTRFTATLGVDWSTNTDNEQYFGSDTTGGLHYQFAHLDQKTLSFTADLGYTVTPDLSVQWYLQPFVSRGTYSNVRRLAAPGADDYDARYQPDTTVTSPGGVDSRQFNSNFVVRWEYRPGSTLFLVWTQGRGGFQPTPGPGGIGDSFRRLWDLRADNTFLVKVSYWFDR